MTLVQQQWCVGGLALPLERATMTLLDGQGGETETEVLLLSLKVSGEVRWLDKFLEKPVRWWQGHGRTQPLMQEFLQALSPQKGTPNTVLPIKLRGKEILCRLARTSPTLAFLADKPDFEGLEWFLVELKKDLVEEKETKRARKGKETKEEEDQQIIDEIMEDIREHGNCEKAWFLDSRSTIKVLTSDERLKEFGVKNAKRTRQEALVQQNWEILRSAFQKAADAALLFLEQKASSAGPHEEPRVPPVEPSAGADDDSQEQ